LEIQLSRDLDGNARELQRLADHLEKAGSTMAALLVGAAALAMKDDAQSAAQRNRDPRRPSAAIAPRKSERSLEFCRRRAWVPKR
jgi:hypothetical protein